MCIPRMAMRRPNECDASSHAVNWPCDVTILLSVAATRRHIVRHHSLSCSPAVTQKKKKEKERKRKKKKEKTSAEILILVGTSPPETVAHAFNSFSYSVLLFLFH